MSETKSKPVADEAARLARALYWREVWRAEMAGAPLARPLKRHAARSNDYAAQMARAEFGRFYVDPARVRQELRDGEIVVTDKRALARRSG